ncbi:chemotaxis protein CheB [Duganella ginsengisoli]|uniref:protein-glutamate methylesterase n=2 Tax=Pseudoduganella ginsengisoli TaxID=1462440 RepID=A0A6L6Q2E7_9BURK|nr:chemotaxis protein CheB [Pseudoduganella ginsengisoli]
MPVKKVQGTRRYSAVAIAVSTGGVEALKRVLPPLPAGFPLPVLVVIHIAAASGDGLARLLDGMSKLHVKEADEGELAVAGTVYMAPPDYHMLVELDGGLALTFDPPVNFARPSADVLFESACASYGPALIGVVLTGAGSDGAMGLAHIGAAGGYTIVQDPDDALMDAMPCAALACRTPDSVVKLDALPALLQKLAAEVQP